LLIVRAETQQIVTFYPIDETEEFEERVQELIEETYYPDPWDDYFYD